MTRWVNYGLVAAGLCVACSPTSSTEDAAVLDTPATDAAMLDAPLPDGAVPDAPVLVDAPSGRDTAVPTDSPDAPLPTCGPPTMASVLVDEGEMVIWTSVGVDGDGEPQILGMPYIGAAQHHTRPLGTWSGSALSATETNGEMAVAADGTAHIVVHTLATMTSYDVVYAQRAPDGTWTETGTRIGAGTYPAIALDEDGVPHVTYRDGATFQYAVRESGGIWDVETAPSLPSPGISDLLIDADGTAHVAVQIIPTPGDTDLVYATRTSGGSWSSEVVDPLHGRGLDPTIAMDGAGTIHLVWVGDTLPFAVSYASRPAGGAWSSIESFGAGSVASWNPRIAVDALGRLHVIFRDHNWNLWYATRSPSGTWAPVSLRTDDIGPNTPSLVIDDSGRGHVSYATRGTGALMYGALTLCP